MHGFPKGVLPLSLCAVMGLSLPAGAQTSGAGSGQGAAAAPPLVLPQAYDSTISSLAALATGGAAALKSYRSDARTHAIRIALSTRLLLAGSTVATISLDKANTETSLGASAILCVPRQNYIDNAVSLNYLNALVQNLNAVSAKPAAPSDIASALKLLLATSSYAISDKVKVDQADVKSLAATALSTCNEDLKSYAEDYYGVDMTAMAAAATSVPMVGAAAPTAGVDTFAFLGPIGSLIDTFLSILQPVLIDASQIVDEQRRRSVIEAALADPAIHTKIETTGKQLADAVDTFAAQSRHGLVGSFVEQLVSIHEMSIDLNGEVDCNNVSPAKPLADGPPNAAFIDCWRAAWAKLQPQVANLNTIGDNYDTLADAGNVSARKLFGTIMADYSQISSGKATDAGVAVFGNDITEFITLANTVANAASKSNISALKSAIAGVSK